MIEIADELEELVRLFYKLSEKDRKRLWVRIIIEASNKEFPPHPTASEN